MTDKFNFKDSPFRFTEPIRYFKANDPYFWEVDNIPLQQLQENILWLRDQLKKQVDTEDNVLEVKRGNLEELRPYATGGDRIVRVKPGRYSARINDASTKDPLGFLQQVIGETLGDQDVFNVAAPSTGASFLNNSNQVLEQALESFKSTVAADAKGMTGLEERVFTWPVVNVDTPVGETGAGVTSETNLSFGAGNNLNSQLNNPGSFSYEVPFPVAEAILWVRNETNDPNYPLTSFNSSFPTQDGFSTLPLLENYLIKAWRGVARTSIVDVSEELSIEVPQFNSSDFNYEDENGIVQSVPNVQTRIDMVFIYSKPIDASGAKIIRNSQIANITKPTLGIVQGAGISLDLEQKNKALIKGQIQATNDSILAHPADANAENTGFIAASGNDIVNDVKGSFPSPDDLLNLAPLLSEKLEANAVELVGQTILPVAYIFVQGDSQVVQVEDVVDIRPFFRTTELAYNERAGIAAAFPQLSLANPAVGKAQLDREISRVMQSIGGVQSDINGIQESNFGPVAAGYVFGGWNFGPEGAILNHELNLQGGEANFSTAQINDVKEGLVSRYRFPAGTNIPTKPDWDVAVWVSENSLSNPGNYPNDYITTVQGGLNYDLITAGSKSEGINPANGLDFQGNIADNLDNITANAGDTQFHIISKKIFFQRPNTLFDYNIDVSLINCVAQNYTDDSKEIERASYFGHWVEKGSTDSGIDYFIIYVAFKTKIGFPAPNNLGNSQREGEKFSAFLVGTEKLLYSNTNAQGSGGKLGYKGNPRMGKCTLPTVMWKMVAIPTAKTNFMYTNLNNPNPLIQLDLSQIK